MFEHLHIVKIGGGVYDSPRLHSFLEHFAKLQGPAILVHGGGCVASELSGKIGVEPKMYQGRRITTAEDLDIVTMVYAGLINKRITAGLQSHGCNALGMSGADANSILAQKRLRSSVDFGYVGDVTRVNSAVIHDLLNKGIVPVFCPLTHDGNGQLLNTNADTIAAELAIAMNHYYSCELIYCFESKGVLADVTDGNSVISSIDFQEFQKLRAKGQIHNGMLPKIENCFHAVRNGVSKVVIGSVELISNPDECGTQIV